MPLSVIFFVWKHVICSTPPYSKFLQCRYCRPAVFVLFCMNSLQMSGLVPGVFTSSHWCISVSCSTSYCKVRKKYENVIYGGERPNNLFAFFTWQWTLSLIWSVNVPLPWAVHIYLHLMLLMFLWSRVALPLVHDF